MSDMTAVKHKTIIVHAALALGLFFGFAAGLAVQERECHVRHGR